MNETYIVGEKKYSVGQSKLSQFFLDFPNAVKETEFQEIKQTQELDQEKLPEDKGWFDDMLTAVRGGSAAGGSVGEAFDVYRQGKNISDEDLQSFIEAAKAIENNPETNEAASWRQDTKKHGGGALGGFMSLLENPGYFPQFIASSLSTMATSLFDSEEVAASTAAGAGVGAAAGSTATALAASIGGPLGTALGYVAGGGAGAIGGGMAGLVGAMETGLTLTDLLRDELGDKEFNQENIRALLNDKDVMDRVKSRSLARGLTIGAVEGLTFGLSRGVGSKIFKVATAKGAVGLSKAGLKTGSKIAAATTAIESVGGGGGEALGMLAAGQELVGEQIFLEAIGEAKGVFNTSDFVRSALTKTSYKLNKEKVTAAKIKEIIDNPNTSKADLAKMDIEVTGDKAFDNFVKQKQNDAVIDSQIDSRITDKADRKKLVELEIKRRKAQADNKKDGAAEVFDAAANLLEVELEIRALLSKYEGAVGFGKTKEAKKIAKVVRNISLSKTIEFLQKNKKFVGKDVIIAENDVDAKIAYDKAVEEYNAKIDSGEIKANKIVDEYSSTDGFILGDVIVVNKDIAGKTGAINVGAHELLHAVVGKHMKTLNSAGRIKLGKSFMNTLTKEQGVAVRKRLKADYKLEGDAVFASEEIFTAFSDAITKGEITFDEGVFSKLKNIIQEILRKVGIKKEFANGRQVYNFLKDYQKSVEAGGEISSRAKSLADGGTYAMGTQASKSTPLEAINSLLPGSITTQEDYYKVLNDPRIASNAGVERVLDNRGKLAPVIEAYIVSKSTNSDMAAENIKSVIKRLANFDPAETRADGSTVGQEGFGEFIFANAKFGKLDAAKNLAIKNKKTKRETSIDTDEAKELADTSTPTTEIEDKTKPRNLKDFDVEIEDGLVDATIEAEVEALLEKNPDNIDLQMERLILKDIRKNLDNVIGKIAKNKKTGKRGPTAEYEAFIRNEYDLIVSSLGIETIRKAYRPWFEKKKIRTEKYKGISPKTGKVTNYVKDVFENKTNKREYIRWFLESNERNLTERRTALIRRIARRKAKIATDSYIETNSKDLGKVAEAKLRILSRAIEDVQIEKKSFDSVKFSQGFMDEFGFLFRKLEQRKKDKKGKGTGNWYFKKEYEKEAIERGLVDSKGKIKSFPNKGIIYEQAFADYFVKMAKRLKIKGFKVESFMASEKGGMADFIMSFNDAIENHEIKASMTAFMGSVSISNFINGKIDFATDIHNEMLDDPNFDIADFEKGYMKSIDFANKRIRELNLTRDKNNQYDEIDPNVTSGEPQYFPKEVYNDKDFPKKVFYVLDGDASVITRHYKPKGVNSISFVNTGIDGAGEMSFRLNDESLLNLDMLDAKTVTNFTFRNGGTVTKNGNEYIAVSLGVQFKITELNNNTETAVDITDDVGFRQAAPASVTVISKSPKATQALNSAVSNSRSANNPTKGITILDFDDTLATSKSLIRYTTLEGEKGTLTPEQYASTYQDLLGLGYKFDFSEFNKVVDGKTAPLFQKALKLQSKFGPKSMFVLTARPAQSAPAIFAFIKANGLNIPLENITGLANSTSEAKALWVAEKVGEGFNDFYFADDALQNVQAVDNMLNQFDVKRKVQQARVKFSRSMNDQFNNILENITGIESQKRFDFIKGRKRGSSKGKFRPFIPPSHEDFVGLLYNFMGKGLEGNKHRDFLEQALVRPLNRANKEHDTARQSVATDYKNLNKQMTDVKKKLIKKTPDGDFTHQDAIRVYLWDKHGYDIPGLSPVDQKNLVELVNSDPSLKSYAETINVISKQEKYVNPTDGWDSGDIRMDLDDATGRIGRAQFFEEFSENADIIFSKENLNKIEAGYGKGVREALEDILYRIKTGRNKPTGQSGMVNTLMNWLNGSVGSVMFFNMRSALLQQMSIVNYINFADNNMFAAAKAFANQKQYWSDWAFIFNSDMLKQRRGGIMTDVNGAELAADMRKSKNPHRFLISKLLEIGFLPTQIGDNIAIATGGASYYRNRINTYLKQGLTQKEAEAKAFTDFQDITQSTQQSARPDMVSQQQASVIGKVILNFQNVTSQFNRLGKKAFQDIYNRRITKPNSTQLQSDISNASRITYYFAVQNAIFYTLQTALFAMMFDDDEDDDNKLFLKKKERLINGSIDSVLRGTGLYGSVFSTLKNVAIAFARQRDVNYNPDESAVVVEALNLSPVLGIKARKIVNAEKTLNYNKKVMDHMETMDIDNPHWSAVTNYIEGFTNLPLNRIYNKTQNIRQGLNNDHSNWERTLLFLGWSQYNLNLANEKMDKIKEDAKNKKTKTRKTRSTTRKTRSTTRKTR